MDARQPLAKQGSMGCKANQAGQHSPPDSFSDSPRVLVYDTRAPIDGRVFQVLIKSIEGVKAKDHLVYGHSFAREKNGQKHFESAPTLQPKTIR